MESLKGVGVKAFAILIGADHSDVSRAVKRGLIHALVPAAGRRGPGSTVLDHDHTSRIAAAVECGMPWRVAAALGDRLEVYSGGVIVRRPARH